MIKNFTIIMILITVIIKTSAGQINFEPYITFETEFDIRTLVVEDINNDGLDDIIVATKDDYSSTVNILIYYQNQSGELDSPIVFIHYNKWSASHSMDVNDFNNDNKLDIAILKNDSLSIFFQLDDITFVRQNFYSGTTVHDLKAGDLNNDGLCDIAISHYKGNFINVFYQNENGELNRITYPSPMNQFSELEIVDIDNDGTNDLMYLLSGGYEDGLFVYLQNEEGLLELSYNINIDFLEYPGELVAGNLNNDKNSDFIINYNDRNLCLFIEDVSSSSYKHTILPCDPSPAPVLIQDINFDGKNEIICTHWGWHALSVYEQNEFGIYSDYQLFDNDYGYYNMDMGVGDLNGDSLVDIAISSHEKIIIHYGTIANSINNLSHKEITVFPNPSNGMINFSFKGRNIKNIKIYDLTGKILIEKTTIQTNETVDLSSWGNGVYIINIQTNKENFKTKIVKL